MKRVLILSTLLCILAASAGCSAPAASSPAATTAPETTAEMTTETETESETESESETETGTETEAQAETQAETVEVIEVVEDGMTPIPASSLKDGEYDVKVSSSSSMFKIESAKLTVADGKMTAVMTMSGTGYLYVFMGTGIEAEHAQETAYIPFEETEDGKHTFTVPVEALDAGIDCAAFSKRKELWYDRTILFRADSLPAEAFADGTITDTASLNLEDGEYQVNVTLEGGSGKATVQSPAKLTIADGKATAEIIWSSNKYDYMVVDGEKIEPVSTEEHSVFEIPVLGFDYKMPVSADTTAMSTPHEIEYTLYFDSASVTK